MSRSIRIAAGLCLCLGVMLTNALAQVPIPPNVRVTFLPQLNNEEQLVICPTDTAVIMANWRDFRLGFRQIGMGRSTDGGQTWTDSLINQFMQINEPANQSDPTMIVDKNGNFLMTALDYNPGNQYGSSRIAMYRSDDKGLSWSGPVPHHAVTLNTFEDKQFTDVDRSGGPFDGSMYIVWARFPNPTRIMCVRVANDLSSVSDTVICGPKQGSTGCGSGTIDAGQFAVPCVDKNGVLHVLWQGYSLDSSGDCTGHTAIKYAKSSNGGANFSTPTPILGVSGYSSSNGGAQTYSQPVTATDLSTGPHSGNLYVAFTNQEDAESTSDIDFIRSTDGGLTWSSMQQINDDPNHDLNSSFHPWLVCNEEGILVAIFYDERYDPFHYAFDLSAAYSFDGGQTWTTNHRVSSASSNPDFLPAAAPLGSGTVAPPVNGMAVAEPMAGRLGEYIAVAAVYDKINAMWTDTRDGNSEAYTATWHMPLSVARLISPASGTQLQAYPTLRWATSWKENDDRYLVEVATDQLFANIVVSQSVDSDSLNVTANLSDGPYYWRVRSSKISTSEQATFSPPWTFTIDNTPPPIPALTTPAFNEVVDTNLPVLNWTMDGGIVANVEYDIYVSPEASFTNPGVLMLYQGISSLLVPPFTLPDPVTQGVLMYWKVRCRDIAGNASESTVSQFMYSPSCCKDLVGNADGDSGDGVDLVDLQVYIDYLFFSGPPADCADEFDVTLDGSIDISDLQVMIDFLFFGASLPACP